MLSGAERSEKLMEKQETRVAVVAVIIQDTAAANRLNDLLHEYGPFIIGRMGLPYPRRGIHVISVAVDAPADTISALSGKLGRLPGVTAKTVYAPAECTGTETN